MDLTDPILEEFIVDQQEFVEDQLDEIFEDGHDGFDLVYAALFDLAHMRHVPGAVVSQADTSLQEDTGFTDGSTLLRLRLRDGGAFSYRAGFTAPITVMHSPLGPIQWISNPSDGWARIALASPTGGARQRR